MSEYVKEVNEGTFEQVVLRSEKPALVDLLGAMVQTVRHACPNS